MAILPRRSFLSDVELGKKDDDRKKDRASRSSTFRSASRWPLFRRQRVFAVLFGLLCVFLFIKNMPIAMGPPPNRLSPLAQSQSQFSFANPLSTNNDRPPPGAVPLHAESEAQGKPSKGGSAGVGAGSADLSPAQTYGGPIKFYSLAKSLYGLEKLRGSRRDRDAVLFAAADLKALADLVPLACSMAEERKELSVHLAVMGRELVSLEGIQRVNSWSSQECPIVWHDARPDYGPWSTEKRMVTSTRAAMVHLHNNINATVVITHDKAGDEPFLYKGVKEEAKDLDMTHITLPDQALDFTWLSKLNINSLEAFNEPTIDILIQATPQTSGSVIRLLRSLQRANFFGPVPSLTIELPPKTDPFLSRYLAKMNWPPKSDAQMFTVRRRITPDHISPEEAAIRTLDAFYPKSPSKSHVLVLSPQTVVSPAFYHYLKYSILHYKYSGISKSPVKRLMGISLDLPSKWPTTGDAFSPPEDALPGQKDSKVEANAPFPEFLWQIPTDSAALYFGDKWVELHSFLHNRHVVTSRSESKAKAQKPELLEKYPSWLGYAFELMRARGYFMVYPAFKKEDDFAIAAVHNELWKQPEEFAGKKEEKKEKESKKEGDTKKKEDGKKEKRAEPGNENAEDKQAKKPEDGKPAPSPPIVENAEATLTAEVTEDKEKNKKKEEKNKDEGMSLDSIEHPILKSAVITDIFTTYPGGLPDLSQLVILPHSKKVTEEAGDFIARTNAYVEEFAKTHGGCKEGEKRPERKGKMNTDDLFCLREEEREAA